MCSLHLIQVFIRHISGLNKIIVIDNVILISKKQQQQITPYNSRFFVDMTEKRQMLSFLSQIEILVGSWKKIVDK